MRCIHCELYISAEQVEGRLAMHIPATRNRPTPRRFIPTYMIAHAPVLTARAVCLARRRRRRCGAAALIAATSIVAAAVSRSPGAVAITPAAVGAVLDTFVGTVDPLGERDLRVVEVRDGVRPKGEEDEHM